MNQEQRAALRKLAEEATPGPWKASALGRTVTDCAEQVVCRPSAYANNAERQVANADYIAANPSTILAMLDYIETLEKDAARYLWLSKYLASDDTSRDDVIVAACDCVEKLNSVIDDVIQGEME